MGYRKTRRAFKHLTGSYSGHVGNPAVISHHAKMCMPLGAQYVKYYTAKKPKNQGAM